MNIHTAHKGVRNEKKCGLKLLKALDKMLPRWATQEPQEVEVSDDVKLELQEIKQSIAILITFYRWYLTHKEQSDG